MNSKPFPMGVVVTLTILWLGLVGALAWGWSTMRDVFDGVPHPSASAVATSPESTASPSAAAVKDGAAPAGIVGPHVTWTQEGLQRFGLKAGGALLGAILFLLLAVGAGLLVQEKAESVDE